MAEIRCRRLCFRRRLSRKKEKIILDSIDAGFKQDVITFIQGETGAGKSTLLHIIASLLRPTSGELLVDNQAISRWNVRYRDKWRAQVGIMFQQEYFFRALTVFENVALPVLPHIQTLSALNTRVCSYLEGVDLLHLAREPLYTLSGGERQRVSLVRALINQPRYLVIDEPTAHQDDAGVEIVKKCLIRAQKEGALVVVASHDPRLTQQEWSVQNYELAQGKLVQCS